eukprot:TRINITY_DN31081_c0_g1_i1.p1 TRINITY_DN31081_c0_g1~~TRINITY_DN31081_c0_g1_i1.p1  ORF type:complete len:653 (+),score=71.78 TRINITY_DN31081_c0_g1_i1:39-1997(+)
MECVAACECDHFCEPLIKDAALCAEQGGSWVQQLSQNFDNVWNAILTLFEISSTEGWVDVMYSACDSTSEYVMPARDNAQWIFAPFFVVYMFLSFMFIINLSVGVIVDKFMDLKESGKVNVMMTEAQSNWLQAQKKMATRRHFFDLTNTHLLPETRQKVYRFINLPAFNHFIMGAITANAVVMGMKVFPSPFLWWNDVMEAIQTTFLAIFIVEFFIKLYALRSRYWKDPWNSFDHFCIVMSALGITLRALTDINISSITSIFRVARLFRLLKIMKGVRKIFTALATSIPKLINVLLILLLLLMLYSILGVSLFSTMKQGETLNQFGNFHNFVYAFITLFRASTGEAWNEIMHDLAKTPQDMYRSGEWCSPDYLFDTVDKYEVLKSKCLIDRPNSCLSSQIGGQFMPAFYWVTYTLVVAIMVMNLVIAVILESYEDGKHSYEVEAIDICVKVWSKYDPYHTMMLPVPKLIRFISEALDSISDDLFTDHPNFQQSSYEFSLKEFKAAPSHHIPLEFAKFLQMPVNLAGEAHFLYALEQVMRIVSVRCGDGGDERHDNSHTMKSLDCVKALLNARDLSRLNWQRKALSRGEASPDVYRLVHHISVMRLQERWRKNIKLRKERRAAGLDPDDWQAKPPSSPGHSPGIPDSGAIVIS